MIKNQLERKFWGRLKNHFSPKVFVRRMENGVMFGDPDVYLMKQGQVVWLELKWAAIPVRSTSKLLGKDAIRLDQINWHLDYDSKGGTSFILIGTHGMDYLMPGALADRLSKMSIEEMEDNATHCCVSIGRVLEKVLWP